MFSLQLVQPSLLTRVSRSNVLQVGSVISQLFDDGAHHGLAGGDHISGIVSLAAVGNGGGVGRGGVSVGGGGGLQEKRDKIIKETGKWIERRQLKSFDSSLIFFNGPTEIGNKLTKL